MRMLLASMFLCFCSCSSLKLKDMNKITAGMSKNQVVEALGEPTSKKLVDGKEIFEYEMKDENGEVKPRIVVFEDREVVFYGKPSEWKESSTSKISGSSDGNHNTNTNTNTVSPTINIKSPNVTVSPIITIAPGSANTNDKRAPATGNTYFHSVPTADELQDPH